MAVLARISFELQRALTTPWPPYLPSHSPRMCMRCAVRMLSLLGQRKKTNLCGVRECRVSDLHVVRFELGGCLTGELYLCSNAIVLQGFGTPCIFSGRSFFMPFLPSSGPVATPSQRSSCSELHASSRTACIFPSNSAHGSASAESFEAEIVQRARRRAVR